jgi:hypothetical protein
MLTFYGRSLPLALCALPVALVLWPIVARDMRLRREGKRPDRWHWADVALLRLGWAYDPG